MAGLPNETKQLYVPSNEILCSALNSGLKKYFKEASVTEIDCPDLTQKPWALAAKGICGSPINMDVGGVPYLIPTPQKKKIYKLDELAGIVGNKNTFFIGAGAGPCHIVGQNSEMMANSLVGENETLKTYIATVLEEKQCCLKQMKTKEFCLLGNLLASEGKQGKVIKINAKARLTDENFPQAIRKVLTEFSPDKMIGMGGVFVIKSGKAKLHIMPDFSCSPLLTDEDVNNWLTFNESSAPLVCLSVFYNFDDGMDLRVEHTHCFSHHGEGGHYHYDTTPEEVEYEGLFVVAEKLIRVDRPKETHLVGRD